jgi:Trypsin
MARTHALLKLARRKASRLKTKHDYLLTVGVGFKHSEQMGYGKSLRHCIKLFVRKKRNRLPERRRLPRRFLVGIRGRNVYMPTDVEELGGLRLHIRPVAAGAPPNLGAPGTPGFLLQGADGRNFLITAGHVLQDMSPQNPWHPPDAPVELGTRPVGSINPPNTYFHSDGFLFDVGVVELQGNDATTLLSEIPWANLKSVADLSTIRNWFYTKTTKTFCRLYGWQTTPYAVLDTLNEDGLPAVGEVYAPVMIMSRSQDADFAPGDSGAPLVYNDEMLVGLHVLGSKDDPTIGWAISAYTLIQQLEQRLGTDLSLFVPR